jgi:dTDP-4-amino-4,6-dideoxygalactose transaminase
MIPRIKYESNNSDVARSFFSNSDYRNKLKKSLVSQFGVKNVLLTRSARSGLYYLLKVLPHKKIYMPAYTCWVVPEAALLAKKKIEYVDINLNDYCVDINALNSVIEKNSIILATHQFGIPCDIDSILQIAKDKECIVIEDNAAAFGSKYNNKITGSFGSASIISFEFTKTLTGARGGAVLFNDEELYENVNQFYLRNIVNSNGFDSLKYLVSMLCYNFATNNNLYDLFHNIFIKVKGETTGYPDYNLQKMDELYTKDISNQMAKLIHTNQTKVKDVIDRRRYIASFYYERLAKIKKVKLPKFSSIKAPVLMRFPFRIDGSSKKMIYSRFVAQGIDLAFTFSYSCDDDHIRFKNSHFAADNVLNLPMYSGLTEEDIFKIVDCFGKIN